MRIYDFHFAPNPRKLRVYLAEKGLSIPFEQVNLVEGAMDTSCRNLTRWYEGCQRRPNAKA